MNEEIEKQNEETYCNDYDYPIYEVCGICHNNNCLNRLSESEDLGC